MKRRTTTIPVTMRFEENWIQNLKEIAREKAYKEGRDISHHDLIKEAVYEKWLKN